MKVHVTIVICGIIFIELLKNRYTISQTLTIGHLNLVACINSIVKDYMNFSGPMILTYSITSSDNPQRTLLTEAVNVQFMDSVLKTLCENPNLSLIVFQPNTIEYINLHFQGCVFIYRLQDENEDVSVDIPWQMSFFISSNEKFNSEVRFVIVILCSYRSVDSAKLVQLLSEIWESYKILNVVIVIPHFCLILPTFVNILPDFDYNVNNGSLDIFTFFPYFINQCNEVNQIHFLDSWLGNGKYPYLRNTDIFPEKITSNLHKCPLRVGTHEFPPIVVVERKNGTVESVNGYETSFIEFLFDNLNASIQYVVIPKSWNNDLRVDTEKLAHKLYFDEVDIIYGALPLFDEMVKIASPSVPYFDTVIEWIVPCPVKISQVGRILNVFPVPVWICIALTFVLITLTVTFRAKYLCPGTKHEISNFLTINESFYNIWSAAMSVSVSRMPQNQGVRVIFLLWISYCLCINTVFQAFFTMYLVTPRVGRKLSTVKDLIDSRTSIHYRQEFKILFNYSNDEEDIYFRNNEDYCTFISNCLYDVVKKRAYATISPSILTEFYIANWSLLDSHLPVCKLENSILKMDVVSYLSKRNPITSRINKLTRAIIECGIMSKNRRDLMNEIRFDRHSKNTEDTEEKSENNYFVFKLSHLSYVFLSLFSSYIAGMFVLVVEVTIHLITKTQLSCKVNNVHKATFKHSNHESRLHEEYRGLNRRKNNY
ncbi:Ionotropic receptor 657 [Blattella germanica]|nr:Ionotropic receptor 657 [Blattella germanica]